MCCLCITVILQITSLVVIKLKNVLGKKIVKTKTACSVLLLRNCSNLGVIPTH